MNNACIAAIEVLIYTLTSYERWWWGGMIIFGGKFEKLDKESSKKIEVPHKIAEVRILKF